MRFNYWVYLCYFIAVGLCPSCCCNKPATPDFTEQEKKWLPSNTYTVTLASDSGDTMSGVINFPAMYSDIEQKCKVKDKRAVVQTNAVLNYKPLPFEFIRIEKYKDSLEVEYGKIFKLSKASYIGTFVIGGKAIDDVYYYYNCYISQKYGLLQYSNYDDKYKYYKTYKRIASQLK